MLGRPLLALVGLIGLHAASASAATATASTTTTRDACPFDGGFSVRVNASTCPPTAPVSCGIGLQPRCCPSGTVCAGGDGYEDNYCCNSSDNSTEALNACISDILDQPRCPVASWGLFNINGTFDLGGFCCQAGNNGTYAYLTNGGIGVECATAPASSSDSPESPFFWAEAFKQATCTTATTSSSSSTSSTATATATTATSSTASSTASPTQTTAAADGGSEVSGGAIGGIVVGSLAGVALGAGVLLFLWRRRRARLAQSAQSLLPSVQDSQPQLPPQQQQVYPVASAYMLVKQSSPEPAPAPVEMDAHSYAVPAELDAGR